MRAGCRFGVVLDGEGRLVEQLEAFHDVVVQADVRDLGAAVGGLGDLVEGRVDGEAWLCAVISTLPVVRSWTGWLMPRWPYFSL